MTFILRIAHRSAQAGVRVVRVPGCERRGNGQSWAARPGGIVNHHTAGENNVNIDQILINGRRDLPGPLTNFATLYDGDLAVVAAHPANHAGASGGWDTAPLPRTRVFNREVVGNEIQYRGTEPMSPAQYRTVLLLNRIALEEIGHGGQWDRIKFHQGTSITGKWDAGYAPGKTYDIRAFRRDVAAGSAGAPSAPPSPSGGAPAFPLPAGYYYGPLDGPKESVSNRHGTGHPEWRAGLRAWQDRMRARGWEITPDGSYGPQTNKVARAFQGEKSLYADGLIGPATWAAAWTAPVN